MWRVSPDGEFRDPMMGKLNSVFVMDEIKFFEYYSHSTESKEISFYNECHDNYMKLFNAFRKFLYQISM